LEHEVIPEFYARDAGGIPRAWVTRMRESMAQLTPQFSTSRVVREYTETYYLPAAISCGARAANNGKIGAELVARRRLMDAGWDAMRFGEVKVQTDATHHVFEVRVDLDHIDPGLIRLELYAEGVGHGPPARQEMARVLKPGPATGNSFFKATVSADRPSTDYTARAMSNEVDLAIPLEDARIRWQR
jgi:starch phosphorylase